jgi:hypothetical protein
MWAEPKLPRIDDRKRVNIDMDPFVIVDSLGFGLTHMPIFQVVWV